MQDNPLLIAAGRFHGHIGPFLAIGLRMGLLATERIGRGPLDMKARIKVSAKPPRSCAVDGIQYVTGCTMGKGNIAVEPDDKGITAVFALHGRSVTVTLRDEFLESMQAELDGKAEKAFIDYAFEIMDTRAEDLFEVSG